ncbi:TetR/AcrR family transcriptional regulator [Xanthobacter dioxanivorans]|uniref:TetR/AcrR family transcriptional regulator n=1 Tax=Xanthobacter dioxanivorans TaxID=2528964 RepID=A0A974PPF5_9HYPH|nr:TetR/AcrR family transcriptional regulator [Xanthobacter dioxanivorans]QRG07347.1 TetR/AcrR family transcriptional regulator [Xanthobacter dioxanivorans]
MGKAGAPEKTRTRRHANRLPAEKRISDIMLAARQVFTERGYDDALISEIAERAGVVEGSIYRFFTNKRDLLVKVVESWYEEMLEEDSAQFSAVRGTWNQIRFVVLQHLYSIRREPGLSRLVFQKLRSEPTYRATRVFQLNQAYTHRIVDIVRAAVAAGELRPDVSAGLVRDLIFGGVEHRTWAFLRNEGDFDPVALADDLTNMVYRAMAIPAEDRPDRLEKAAERLEKAAERLERLVDDPAR